MAEIILTEKDWARFQANVWRGTETTCAIWSGALHYTGYGSFSLRGQHLRAHRVAFLAAGGILTPEKPDVLHTCDVPACVETAHLFAGNDRTNAEDRAKKKRGRKSGLGLPYGVFILGSGRFGAQSWDGHRKRYFGAFDTAEEASAVALAERAAMRGW